mmetsp:Transcript_17407/g.41266  ORF Transcript_17407/g.41266 Transcript_17407/m.41266 type:complete len:207 (+) Transcript_17407:367-987(+)
MRAADLVSLAAAGARISGAPVHCHTVGAVRSTLAFMLVVAALHRAALRLLVAAVHLLVVPAGHLLFGAVGRAGGRGAPIAAVALDVRRRLMAGELPVVAVHRATLSLGHANAGPILLGAGQLCFVAGSGAGLQGAPIHPLEVGRLRRPMARLLLFGMAGRGAALGSVHAEVGAVVTGTGDFALVAEGGAFLLGAPVDASAVLARGR